MDREEVIRGFDRDLAGRLLAFGRPYLGRFLLAVAAVIAATAAELSIPLVFQRSIDGIIARSLDPAGLGRNALLLLGLLTVLMGFTFAQILFTAQVGQLVMKDIRMRLFGHLSSRSLAWFSGQPTGRLVNRLTNDVETVNELFTSVLPSFVKDLFVMAGVVLAMTILNPGLALAAGLTLPPVLIATMFYRVKARDAFRTVRLWTSRFNTYLSEHLAGMPVIQLFTREARVRGEYAGLNASLKAANLGEMYVFATFRPIIDFLSATSVATVLYFGGVSAMGGSVSLGTLIAFINLLHKFYQPVMDISEKYTLLQSAMAGGERIFSLLEERAAIPDLGRMIPPRPLRGLVEFRGVSFGYKAGEPVLKAVDFKLEAGKSAAIVGYTGSGKTTIANLLSRLWDVDGGAVLIDGIDLRDVPLAELRSLVQPIQQDVFLFSDSIRENILLGLELEPAALERVVEDAQLKDLLSRLPESLDTVLSEGASNISAGQRQLISIARIMAHDPPVLILDEATSSIDSETERLIQLALNRVMAGRTSLVIAHRLSTIRHASLILVVEDGRIVESGRHEELLARAGAYHALYRLQYGGED